jgi:hypothetical protein
MSWTNKQMAFLNDKNAHIAELTDERDNLRGLLQRCVDSDLDGSNVEFDLWCEIEKALIRAALGVGDG